MQLGSLNPWRVWGSLDAEAKRDARIAALLVLFGIAVYLPGIGWGLPFGTEAGLIRGWAPDEIGPNGPLAEVANLIKHGDTGNPQYPMFHYFVCLAFYVPYLAFLFLTGGIAQVQNTYPFGFVNPPAALRTLLVLARLASVLAGAGTSAVAYFTAKRLWNRTAGVLAGLLVLLIYSWFYYARVSNTDAAAAFWASLGLYVFVRIIQDGMSVGRAAWLGLIAALAVATKDPNYGVFLLLPLVMLPVHYSQQTQAGVTDVWERMKAPLAGLVACVAVYVVASGFVFYPAKFFKHVEFIRGGSTDFHFYFEYPATLAGYWGLAQRSFGYIVDSLNWLTMMAAIAGVFLTARKDWKPLALLLPVAATFITVLAPVRYVELRYVLVMAYILALFAACAFADGLRSPRTVLRALTGAVLAASLGWSALRAADLTYLLAHESRVAAGEWFAQNLKPPLTIEYFGTGTDSGPRRMVFLPRLPDGAHWAIAKVGIMPDNSAPSAPYVIVLGTEDLEKNWYCPAWALRKLRDGSFGYRRVALFETKTLFSHRSLRMNPNVNPPIEIYQRMDSTAAPRPEKTGGL